GGLPKIDRFAGVAGWTERRLPALRMRTAVVDPFRQLADVRCAKVVTVASHSGRALCLVLAHTKLPQQVRDQLRLPDLLECAPPRVALEHGLVPVHGSD